MARKRGTPFWREVPIVVALIGLVGVVGAALITSGDEKDTSAGAGSDQIPRPGVDLVAELRTDEHVGAVSVHLVPNPTMDTALLAPAPTVELIELLEFRAEDIRRTLESEETRLTLLARIDTASAAEHTATLANFQTLKSTFTELHRRNVNALRNGQMVLAHEITRDIHHLLYVADGLTHSRLFERLYHVVPIHPDSIVKRRVRTIRPNELSRYEAEYPAVYIDSSGVELDQRRLDIIRAALTPR